MQVPAILSFRARFAPDAIAWSFDVRAMTVGDIELLSSRPAVEVLPPTGRMSMDGR